jgi:serine phosphatase RsbU (regulator of sigma subunit)
VTENHPARTNQGPSANHAGGPSLFADSAPVALSCLEIFGGNGAMNTAVAIPGLDAWVYSKPHEADHGGDIHYITACGSGNIARVLVADVSGHGEQVQQLARTLRDSVRRNIETLDMRRLARSLNDAFSKSAANGRFATAIVATFFAPSSQLILVNAGHPRPILFDARAGAWRAIGAHEPGASTGRGPRNLPLGVIEGVDYEQFAVDFHEGDALLLVTDAVVEAKDRSGEMLGEPGLVQLLNASPDMAHERVVDSIVRALRDRTGQHFADDDLSIILLRRNHDGARSLSMGEHARVWMKRFGFVDDAPSMVSEEQLHRLSRL